MICLKCNKEFNYEGGHSIIEIEYYKKNEKSYSISQRRINRFSLCNKCLEKYNELIDKFLSESEEETK